MSATLWSCVRVCSSVHILGVPKSQPSLKKGCAGVPLRLCPELSRCTVPEHSPPLLVSQNDGVSHSQTQSSSNYQNPQRALIATLPKADSEGHLWTLRNPHVMQASLLSCCPALAKLRSNGSRKAWNKGYGGFKVDLLRAVQLTRRLHSSPQCRLQGRESRTQTPCHRTS